MDDNQTTGPDTTRILHEISVIADKNIVRTAKRSVYGTQDFVTSHPSSQTAHASINAEANELASAPKHVLRARYVELFRCEPPKAFGPDLLRRSVVYRIHEAAFGGLPKLPRRLLDRLVQVYLAKPDAKLPAPRRIKPGSILVREWKGATHQVTVLEEGFAWQGKIRPSLSVIAREITGTRWNGPRFFGLRADQSAGLSNRHDKTHLSPTPAANDF